MTKLAMAFVVAIASSSPTAQTAVVPPCPTMEVSVLQETPAQAGRTFSSVEGTPVRVTATPLATMADFTKATVSLTDGQVVLNVTLNPTATGRVQAFSSRNVGKHLAFIVNRRVIQTPKILDPITGNGFIIAPFERDEAERLAASINAPDTRCRQPATNK